MICKLISDPYLSPQCLIVPVGLTGPDERDRIPPLITRCAHRCLLWKPYCNSQNSHFPEHSPWDFHPARGCATHFPNTWTHPAAPSESRGPISRGKGWRHSHFASSFPWLIASPWESYIESGFLPYYGVISTLPVSRSKPNGQGNDCFCTLVWRLVQHAECALTYTGTWMAPYSYCRHKEMQCFPSGFW